MGGGETTAASGVGQSRRHDGLTVRRLGGLASHDGTTARRFDGTLVTTARRILWLQTLDDYTPQTLLEQFGVEVDEQPEPELRRLEIRHDLFPMNGAKRLDRFQLDDDKALNDQIDPMSAQ